MERRELPNRRRSWTQRCVIGGATCYLTAGEYDDGTLGEIFVTVSKAGSALRGVMDAFARNFSVALQHGTPLVVLLKTHRGTDFAPQGPVVHDDSGSEVVRASSIIDWVTREVENAYLRPAGKPLPVRRCDPPAPEKAAGYRSTGNGV